MSDPDRPLTGTRSIARCGMSWRICSRIGASVDDELRRMDRNGAKHVAIWGSLMKRVATICRSRRKRARRVTFIAARIANQNFRAFVAFVARSRVLPAAGNTTAAISIRSSGSNSVAAVYDRRIIRPTLLECRYNDRSNNAVTLPELQRLKIAELGLATF